MSCLFVYSFVEQKVIDVEQKPRQATSSSAVGEGLVCLALSIIA